MRSQCDRCYRKLASRAAGGQLAGGRRTRRDDHVHGRHVNVNVNVNNLLAISI